MCEFVSWKEYQGKVLFLTKDIIAPRLEDYKKFNPNWHEDICGHGAIEWFLGDGKTTGWGRNCECTDFSSPKNFPPEIVKAIKMGMLEGIGVCLEILTPLALEEYEKIKGQAWEEYEKIKGQAWEKYEKIQGPAWEKYEKIQGPAWEKYEKIQGQAFWKITKVKKNRRKEWK